MVSNIRIIDPYVLELIERERSRAKESTSAKTAQRMIIERATQLERVDSEAMPESGDTQKASAS